ncbi:hypothetical protein HDC30_001335 [Pseudomonas sp. JAI115]|nr:hypothetical protein [Pseudomonas sp. JAI115]
MNPSPGTYAKYTSKQNISFGSKCQASPDQGEALSVNYGFYV